MALVTITPYLANDKYRATLRSTWIASPADTSLLVDAIPDNTPSIAIAGWNTDAETVFTFTGTSGDSPSNYALTGVTRLKGANQNLPSGTSINCLNNEEFFNQYGEAINDVIDEINGLSAVGVVALTDGATPALDASLGDTFVLAAGGNRTIGIPSNPVNGKRIVIIHYASGAARTLALNSGTGGFIFGSDVAALTETESGKRDVIGAIYYTTMNKWLVVGYAKSF